MTNPMKVPLLDLSIKDAAHKDELLAAVERVLTHGRFIMGPEHDEFEAQIAAYCRSQHCVGVGSGSAALYMALRALDIGPGDEVVTTPMTWVATSNAITLCGATPVMADIDDGLNIDPARLEAVISKKTKVILPVHFTGHMCDITQIMEIADRHGIPVVEDAAQAFGAEFNGRKAGSFGKIGCFSMNPMKVFRGYGEAGTIITDDAKIAERIRSLRYNGTINKENCREPSINGRLDTIQAAMLLVNLRRVDDLIEARRRIAKDFTNQLSNIVGCPKEKLGHLHSYYSYTIVSDHRDELKQYLTDNGIETKVQHPFLMTQHDAYRGKIKGDIPNAERLVARILSIPSHEDLDIESLQYVAETIRQYYNR
jgi:dTDP-4-amino-4,6-dideoxygalactose transaminase